MLQVCARALIRFFLRVYLDCGAVNQRKIKEGIRLFQPQTCCLMGYCVQAIKEFQQMCEARCQEPDVFDHPFNLQKELLFDAVLPFLATYFRRCVLDCLRWLAP